MDGDHCEPSPFESVHHIVAIVHPMTTPGGNQELVAHLGGFCFNNPNDPRLQYGVMEWPEHIEELDWVTPAMALRNLLGLNDMIGQVMTGILSAQVNRELRKRTQREPLDKVPPERLPDAILAGLADISFDLDQEGEPDAGAEGPAEDNPPV